VLAVNSAAPALASAATRPAGEAWQVALQRWIDASRRRSASRLSPWFLVVSLSLLLAAVLLWPRAGAAGEVAHP
jgi:hypothetical protein